MLGLFSRHPVSKFNIMANHKILVVAFWLSRLFADEQKMVNAQQVIAGSILLGLLVNMVFNS